MVSENRNGNNGSNGNNNNLLNELFKNPIMLILMGALSGGTGSSFFVDDKDRFRGSDAEKMETRLMNEIERRFHPHDIHLNQSEKWKETILELEHDCRRAREDIEDLRDEN